MGILACNVDRIIHHSTTAADNFDIYHAIAYCCPSGCIIIIILYNLNLIQNHTLRNNRSTIKISQSFLSQPETNKSTKFALCM